MVGGGLLVPLVVAVGQLPIPSSFLPPASLHDRSGGGSGGVGFPTTIVPAFGPFRPTVFSPHFLDCPVACQELLSPIA